MPSQKPRLRAREIVFAVTLGGLAAGGAALTLSALDDDPMAFVGPPDASARPSEMSYDVAPFDEISAAGPQDVVISYGEELAVRSEGPPQALALLEATVEDGRLKIAPRSGFNWFRAGQLEGATFYVTMPKINSVALAGTGNVQIDQIKGGSFSATIAGSGELSIGKIEADDVDFTINGAGNIQAVGTVGSARISISGAGDIGAADLRSKTASISIGGAGDVELSVDEEAKISIMGAGDVDITGTSNCTVTRMGGGDVRCNGVEIEAN